MMLLLLLAALCPQAKALATCMRRSIHLAAFLSQVTGLSSVRVVAVAAGREHALAATDSGQLYSWGGSALMAGRTGQLAQPGLVENIGKRPPYPVRG